MNNRQGILAEPLLQDSRHALQLHLETEMQEKGVAHYLRRRADAERRGKHLTLPPNRRLAVYWFDRMRAAINTAKWSFENGTAERDIALWGPVFSRVDSSRLAAITLERVFDLCVSNPTGVPTAKLVYQIGLSACEEFIADDVKGLEAIADAKYEKRFYSEVALAKIQRLPDEYRPWKHFISRYKDRIPGLLRYWAKDILPTRRHYQTYAKTGAMLLDLLESVADLPRQGGTEEEPNVQPALWTRLRIIHQHGNRIRKKFTKFDDEVLASLEGLHDRRSLLRPRFGMMVVAPYAWSVAKESDARADLGLVRGGYATLKGSLVSRITPEQRETITAFAKSGKLNRFLDCFNAVQTGAAWRVFTRLVEVQKAMYERGGGRCALPHFENADLPRRPPDVTGEDEQAWLQAYRMTKRSNAQRVSLRQHYVNIVEMAEAYATHGRIYSPGFVDFRGRYYARSVGLNHQGDDPTRAMLLCDDAVPLTAEGLKWLKVRSASMFGLGKSSFSAREKWADEHLDEMIRCGIDPVRNDWWTKAKKPWQFLASCMGFHDPENIGARLPVARDGSANVFQWFAALTRDHELGKMVNLTPGDEPQKAYDTVADICRTRCEGDAGESIEAALVLPHIDGDMVKPGTMTTGYGVTMIGARAQVAAEFSRRGVVFHEDANQHRELMNRCSMYLANAVVASVAKAFPRVKATMDWMRRAAATVCKTGKPYSFVTPLGWPMIQPYRDFEEHKVSTVCGAYSFQESSAVLPLKKKKQGSAAAPNTIHPFDATWMYMVGKAVTDHGCFYAPNHDSHSTHASTVASVDRHVREVWVKLHKMDLLADLKDQIERTHGVELDDLPEYGSLDIEAVRDANYFCH